MKGERLALLARLEAPGAILQLSPPAADERERNVTVQLNSTPAPGTALPIEAYIEDRNEPLTFPGALQITGPLPVIASSKLSLPAGMAIAIRPEEFPAGYTFTAMLDVKNIEGKSVLRLACSDDPEQSVALHLGEQTAKSNLQRLSEDQLFLSFDTSAWPAGCSLQAVIDNGRDGKSQPFTLAHLIRLPQIDSFTTTGDPPQNGARPYVLTGQNLEMIEKAGWDQTTGVPIDRLPAPIPGAGQKQTLQVSLPDPPNLPAATLYIWLRGDKQARATSIKATPLLSSAS